MLKWQEQHSWHCHPITTSLVGEKCMSFLVDCLGIVLYHEPDRFLIFRILLCQNIVLKINPLGRTLYGQEGK